MRSSATTASTIKPPQGAPSDALGRPGQRTAPENRFSERGGAFSADTAATGPKQRQRAAVARPSTTLRTACVMGGLYLCGLSFGSLCSRMLREPLLTYARYFASIDLNLHTESNGAMVFSVSFLSLFFQLTLLLLAGFCVLGVGLIPMTMLVKGVGTGIFTALVYQELGTIKGMLMQGLVLWLPEVLGSLLVISLSASALHVSCSLLRYCLGRSSAGMRAAARRLIHRYLAINFFSMLVCGLSVVLTLIFGGLF